MLNSIKLALVASILTLSTLASAQEPTKTSKPVVCTEFSEAKLADGKGSLGVCVSAKGKATYLRSYRIVTIPGAPSVMVGFR